MKIPLSEKHKLKYNEIFAELMGFEINTNYNRKMYQHKDTKELVSPESLKYNSSWDWLIPVYHKFKEANINLWFSDLYPQSCLFLSAIQSNDIERAYIVVIKLYNHKLNKLKLNGSKSKNREKKN